MCLLGPKTKSHQLYDFYVTTRNVLLVLDVLRQSTKDFKVRRHFGAGVKTHFIWGHVSIMVPLKVPVVRSSSPGKW